MRRLSSMIYLINVERREEKDCVRDGGSKPSSFLSTGCRLASDRHLMRVVALVMATGSLKKHHSIPVKGHGTPPPPLLLLLAEEKRNTNKTHRVHII